MCHEGEGDDLSRSPWNPVALAERLFTRFTGCGFPPRARAWEGVGFAMGSPSRIPTGYPVGWAPPPSRMSCRRCGDIPRGRMSASTTNNGVTVGYWQARARRRDRLPLLFGMMRGKRIGDFGIVGATECCGRLGTFHDVGAWGCA